MKESHFKISKGATVPVAQYENRSVHATGEVHITDEEHDPIDEYNKIDEMVTQLVQREVMRIKEDKHIEGEEKIYASTDELRKTRRHTAESEIDNCKTLKELEEIKPFVLKVHKGLKDARHQGLLQAHYEVKKDELTGGEDGRIIDSE